MAELRVELERKTNQQTLWLGGLVITCFSLLASSADRTRARRHSN